MLLQSQTTLPTFSFAWQCQYAQSRMVWWVREIGVHHYHMRLSHQWSAKNDIVEKAFQHLERLDKLLGFFASRVF